MTITEIHQRLRFIADDFSKFPQRAAIKDCETCGSVFFISEEDEATVLFERYVFHKDADNWQDCEVCADIPEVVRLDNAASV